MNDETKPTLAAGMAKRSLWIAIAGGCVGTACTMELLGRPTQALLSLVAIAFFLIAIVFGAVALIRISAADRKVVLMPALVGLVLGLAMLSKLTNWARHQWVRERLRSSQAEETQPQPVPQPQRASATPPKATIQYILPTFDQIPQVATEARSVGARSTGDDGAVQRAWGMHLEKLHAAYTNTLAASNKLHEIDLLDPKLISNFDNDEPVRRRGLANKYHEAWHALGENLSTFSGSYYTDLHNERVSAERSTAEAQALSRFVELPEITARVATLRKHCEAEKAVGRHYNYAVSAVFTYALLASKVPNPPPNLRKEMDNQVAKLKEAEQAAADARREVLSLAAPNSQQHQVRADSPSNP